MFESVNSKLKGHNSLMKQYSRYGKNDIDFAKVVTKSSESTEIVLDAKKITLRKLVKILTILKQRLKHNGNIKLLFK